MVELDEARSTTVSEEPRREVSREHTDARPKPSRDRRRRLEAGEALVVEAPIAHGVRRNRIEGARRRLLVLADGSALVVAWAAVVLAGSQGIGLEATLVALACLPVALLLNASLGLYSRDLYVVRSSTLDEFPRLALSAFIGPAFILIVIAPLAGVPFGRGQTLLTMALSVIALCVLRSVVRAAARRRYPPERCIIVGRGEVASTLAEKITGHPEYGVELAGMIDYAPVAGPSRGSAVHLFAGRPHTWRDREPAAVDRHCSNGAAVHDPESFGEVCRYLGGVDRVLIAFSTLSHEDLLEIVSTSKALGLKVSVVPRLFEAIGHRVEVDQVEGITLLGLRGVARSGSELALKRALDLVLTTAALLILSPLFAAIALAVKLGSPGPVLFAQKRIGRDSKPFRLYKFRTMVLDADALKGALAARNEAVAPMFKIADDPRVTHIGHHLRRLSLDELPQLWNVIRGEMSIVGPRPLVPNEDDHVVGRHRSRLNLAPGITGPWQVQGRNTIPFHDMVKLDYMYVAEWSLWNDLKLMLRTVPVVLGARGS